MMIKLSWTIDLRILVEGAVADFEKELHDRIVGLGWSIGLNVRAALFGRCIKSC
jgi:hypothetical protein